jgi:ribosomal protein S18 acetylase RimI-like enzyme
MNLQFYRETVTHHGVAPALYHAAFRAVNRLAEVVVLDAVAITGAMLAEEFRVDPASPPGRLMDAEGMEPYASDPENALAGDFLDDAVKRGDRCYAIFDGDKLASYGWYATKPTRLREFPGDGILYFDPRYAYMHNGFTRPEYRGRRLHAAGMAAALQDLVSSGLDGLVSYVAASNFASLKSCERMGYEKFGRLFMAKVGSERMWHSSASCARYGFHVAAEPW